MWCINNDVIFVCGAYNAAIYDFRQNRIFSVNCDAKKLLLRIIHGDEAKTVEEKEYISNLEQQNLISSDFKIKEYNANSNIFQQNKLNFVWLEITQNCNLRCIHCYEGETHQSNKNVLSINDWKRIIKELSEINCKNIQFIGGEPSCYFGIIELIDYASQFRFNSIGYFTNATLLTNDLLCCLIRNKVVVNISLYGHTAELHDSITKVKGSFEKTVANIKKLMANNIVVKVAVTLMHENEMFFEAIIDFVKSIGVKYYKYDLVRAVNGCVQGCHPVEREDLIETKYLTKPNFSINKLKFDKAMSVNTCWYGKFAITENGDVIPCVFERSIFYGNLKSNSVQQILDSNKLTECWHMDFSKINECCDCEYRYACRDCRPLRKVDNGSIYGKKVRCFYHPLIGKWEDK